MAIKATKIRLKSGASGDDEREISQIYIVTENKAGWCWVTGVIKILDVGGDISVDKYPNTYLKVVNANPKYVRSEANNRRTDNLLKLPQE